MKVQSIASALLVGGLFIGRTDAVYVHKTRFSGPSFFDSFNFFTAADPTNGFVEYVDRPTALSNSYIGLSNHSLANNSVYIGVDHTRTIDATTAGAGRQSVRIVSNETWTHGLITLNVYHMPTGCGLWPAIWLIAPEGDYPGTTGEIDIVEGVHNMTGNAMTLHTGPGCTVQNSTGDFVGTLKTDDCYVAAPGQSPNSGCSISSQHAVQSSTGSQQGATPRFVATAGHDFNAHGGGVYALVWTSESIEVYFFPRTTIPSNLLSHANSNGKASAAPDPTTWASKGHKPLARFTGCDLDAHIRDLALVINTDFCGGWAGGTWSSSGCAASTGVESCDAYVAAHPEAFVDAYWLLGGVEVWQET